MREILFKAKRKDNGEWAEGDLQQDKDQEENMQPNWKSNFMHRFERRL